jgi:hypothetical protein
MSSGEKMEEGWYWVRWNDEPGGAWEPAEVRLVRHKGRLGIYRFGEDVSYDAEDFEIGPRLQPPGKE